MPIQTFLSKVEAYLKTGNATEHTYRPDLRDLFEAVILQAKAINEPKHATYGAPDFVIQRGNTPIGHVEAKDVGISLEKAINDSEQPKPKTSDGKQLRRYRAALPNLIYTDGLKWFWFVNGESRLEKPIEVATWNKAKKKFSINNNSVPQLLDLLQQFASQQVLTVQNSKDLATRLAQVTRWLYEVIVAVFKEQEEKGELHTQFEAFRKTLLPTLSVTDFADMYAQTIVYGLFAARVTLSNDSSFTRQEAANAIPKTNPFLRKLFQQIAGYDVDERIAWLVNDCANLLAHTDMTTVLRDFGRATKQEDPVVHFYETFLGAYDPALREKRGVYYTPEPVVNYIVRSVNSILTSHFHKPMGLADDKAIILDPATGTATFLHTAIQKIYEILQDSGLSGTWTQYVSSSLLPRMFGLELLMAPYTVAHLKIGLLLGELGYNFGSNERLRVYLTNTLADIPTGQQPLAFAQHISEEGHAANSIKHDIPVMVILGNPPYSNFGKMNKGTWIEGLLKDYKKDLQEKKINLDDDYIKFIRFAQWKIEASEMGVLAFITNHSFLTGVTHRQMRRSLMETFDDIYVLDLHGNTKRKEHPPEGIVDQNVFDIQQGVCITIFVRSSSNIGPAKVHHAELWGDRKTKYDWLSTHDISTTPWQELTEIEQSSCIGTFYFFTPKEFGNIDEYCTYSGLQDIFGLYRNGIKLDRDPLFLDFNRDELLSRMATFYSPEGIESEFSKKYEVRDSSSFSIIRRRSNTSFSAEYPRRMLYRPFDIRWVYYNSKLVSRPATEVMKHMLRGENLGLITTRQTNDTWGVLATDILCGHKSYSSYDINSLFPLYIYPDDQQFGMFEKIGVGGRLHNFSSDFVFLLEKALKLQFIPDGRGDLIETFGPEDIFHYMYALFHASAYRERYEGFLSIAYARLPVEKDLNLFRSLVKSGAELVDLHLLRLPGAQGVGGNGGANVLVSPGKQGVSFPQPGSNIVNKVTYQAVDGSTTGRVYINDDQFFDGVDDVAWSRIFGGYIPLQQWLEDRSGITLSVDDIQHYLRIAVSIREMTRIVSDIDQNLPDISGGS